MARFLVASLLLLCLVTQTTLAQYGRSAPRSSSSSSAGYRSSGSLSKPTSKPSTTGGYGGSYGAIYDNPSGTSDEIDQLEDEELEEVEQPPPPQVSGPAPVRAGYGTFREPPVESAASFSQLSSSSNAFNGPRYAPPSSQRAAPLSSSFGRQSFTTARPRRVNQEDVLPIEEATDEFEQVPTFRQQRPQSRSTAVNYGRPTYNSGPVGGTQFSVQGPQTSQRQQNAVIYGGSVPQLFGGNTADRDFGDDNDDDDESQQTVDSAELSGNQYAGNYQKRPAAGRSYGGSVPQKTGHQLPFIQVGQWEDSRSRKGSNKKCCCFQ